MGEHGQNSGGVRPSWPSAPLPPKSKRRPFVAPPPRPIALPPRQEAPPGGGLPPRHDAPSPGFVRREEVAPPGAVHPRVLYPAAAATTSFSRPHSRRNTDIATSSSLHADTRSTSTPPLGYDAAVDDDYSPTPTPFFDWTPTQDPMAYTSQPFMSLLTQDSDPDLELLTQPLATASGVGKGAAKRGSNYSLDEDIQLCISWMNISNDPIIGNEQHGKTYWERIADDFHRNKNFVSERSPNSLEHRCGIILKECMKFQGCYEDVERRRPSGVPHQEHMLEAQARFARISKGKNFTLTHCWLKLRHCEKFASIEINKRPTKSRSNQEGDGQEANQGQESSSNPPAKKPRPPGRKQSKEKQKGNGGEDEYKDIMQNLLVMKTEEHMMKKERWNSDTMLEQRRLELDERRLKWEQDQKRLEEEHKIMFCDVTKMDEYQRTYVLAKRAEIAKAASLSSSGGASVGESADTTNFSSV